MYFPVEEGESLGVVRWRTVAAGWDGWVDRDGGWFPCKEGLGSPGCEGVFLEGGTLGGKQLSRSQGSGPGPLRLPRVLDPSELDSVRQLNQQI